MYHGDCELFDLWQPNNTVSKFHTKNKKKRDVQVIANDRQVKRCYAECLWWVFDRQTQRWTKTTCSQSSSSIHLMLCEANQLNINDWFYAVALSSADRWRFCNDWTLLISICTSSSANFFFTWAATELESQLCSVCEVVILKNTFQQPAVAYSAWSMLMWTIRAL